MATTMTVYDIHEVDVSRVRSGQSAPYADCVSEWNIITKLEDIDEDKLWEFCQNKLMKCDVRDDTASHTGHCGFPYGLSSFGSLVRTGKFQWVYMVTFPYDD